MIAFNPAISDSNIYAAGSHRAPVQFPAAQQRAELGGPQSSGADPIRWSCFYYNFEATPLGDSSWDGRQEMCRLAFYLGL
jgi:hypothetical protein